jgi:predicted DNA-binding protein with PD1-like motif
MNTEQKTFTSNMKAHVLRLLPGEDLYIKLKEYLYTNNIKAAFIMTCVGSLRQIHLRTAAGSEVTRYIKEEKFYEIVSLVGCVSVDRCHVHIGLSENNGNAIGGHLMSEGNIVYTTAEIVLSELPELTFSEQICEKSGWPELVIENKLN